MSDEQYDPFFLLSSRWFRPLVVLKNGMTAIPEVVLRKRKSLQQILEARERRKEEFLATHVSFFSFSIVHFSFFSSLFFFFFFFHSLNPKMPLRDFVSNLHICSLRNTEKRKGEKNSLLFPFTHSFSFLFLFFFPLKGMKSVSTLPLRGWIVWIMILMTSLFSLSD